MFDFVRKHIKIMQFVLFLLIVPSFVLFGLDGYTRMRDKGEVVARVAGRDVMQSEWDAAHKNEVERLRQNMPGLDPKLLDSPEAKYGTLERLVRERVLSAASEKMGLTTSNQRLERELQSDKEIAALRKPDGTLDMERYRQLLAAQGMSPAGYEAAVRSDLASRQVMLGVGGSGLVSKAVADTSLNAFFERREIQFARFDTNNFSGKVSLADADLERYYKDNASLFQAPESATIEYVVLDIEAIQKTITVNEQDLKTYFEQNAARLSGKEERRASHILIASPKAAPAADRAKAKAKAEELLAQVKKTPDAFADLAKKNSQDPGSADNGGDLDFFARGVRGEAFKSFDDTVFAMQKGEISPVVETELGYHILRLTDIKSPKQRSFEEMKPELEAEFKKQQAQRKYSELAEAFTNMVYEQPDSLKPVAERFKLELNTASNVTRKPAVGAKGALANPKFLASIFSPDSIEKKRNTEAVDVGANQLASARITQHTPARTLPFADVKDQVRARLLEQRGAELAKKEGADKLAAWKSNAAAASLGDAVVVARDQPQKLPQPLVEAALRADSAVLPAWVGVDLGAQGYAVVKVNKLVPREASATVQDDRKQYGQWWAAAENMAYYNALKERFKVEIKVAKPAPKTDAELAAAAQ
jgi:peptidyl-prolyl cis-trans isomerase D